MFVNIPYMEHMAYGIYPQNGYHVIEKIMITQMDLRMLSPEHIALTVFFSSYEQHLTPVIVGSIYNPITTIGIARLTILVINL